MSPASFHVPGDSIVKHVDFGDGADVLGTFSHLVEYQAKPTDLPKEHENFRVRETFPLGNLLCGDLVINEEATKQLEMHPFPEWVVQLQRLDTPAGALRGYCIALDMTAKDLRKLEKKDWRERKDAVKELVKACTPEQLVAFAMAPGICVKVPANVPHYFVSARNDGTKAHPYCQVFEPAIAWDGVAVLGRFDPTAYFSLPFEATA